MVACIHDWEKSSGDNCMFVCSKCRVAFAGNVIDSTPYGWTGKYQYRHEKGTAYNG